MKAHEILFHPNDTMAFNRKKLARCLGTDSPDMTPEVARLVRRYRKKQRRIGRRADDAAICADQPWKRGNVQ